MNDEAGTFLFGVLLGVFGGLILAVALTAGDVDKESANLRKHAVEHGYAKYELNQSTGEIEFKWEEEK